MADLLIEVYSDLNCPWCFIGSSRMETVIDSLERPERVDYVHRPFVVDPSIPEEGINVFEIMQRRYGGPPPALAYAEAEARASGVPFDHRRQPFVYASQKGQALLANALERGTQRALAKELYRANFTEQAKISSTDYLAQLGARHGFTAEEAARIVEDPAEIAAVVAASDTARRMGVRSVPHFVFNKAQVFGGCRREVEMAAAIIDALAGRTLTPA